MMTREVSNVFLLVPRNRENWLGRTVNEHTTLRYHQMRRSLLALCLLLSATAASADTFTVDVELDSLELGRYRLAGQSAFIQTRTGSSTSGGQLDGLESGTSQFSYLELFPAVSLSDYLDFAYFGVIETLDEFDQVIDTSLVVAYQPGSGVGELVQNRFSLTESTLVTALTTSFDSPEFEAFFNEVLNESATRGVIAIPPIGRPGDVLDLVAFIGADSEGVKVGTLGVTVVPEPGTFGLLLAACGALLVVARRRK